MCRHNKEPMLGGFRALDLTDEKGYLCGQILGGLGMDVIKIEPPGGDGARNIGSFYHDIKDPQKNLYWFAYNLNKRGITLNIQTAGGREIFKKLCKSADFVIDSFPPGYMEGLGLGYSTLSGINPRIIMTSVTPFGQTGHYKDYKASDIVCMAMGGFMYLTGDPDRAPLRISFPQAYLIAGLEAAMATIIAHYYRQVTGEGQHVDTSIQAAVASLLENAVPMWVLNRLNVRRAGPFLLARAAGGAKYRMIWRCKDGFVSFHMLGAPVGTKTNRAITEWMASQGMAPDFMVEMDWNAYDMTKQTPELQARIEEPVARFFEAHTKQELYEGAINRQIMLYPVSIASENLEHPQLKARDYWMETEHPELGITITYPGPPVQASEAPYQVRHRAPLIGEHNQEIYQGELGLSTDQLRNLKQANVCD
jgi:crotonobetainyl-CoA:carnitine CoA-transferase CaiB-like acyl-CoA transferase